MFFANAKPLMAAEAVSSPPALTPAAKVTNWSHILQKRAAWAGARPSAFHDLGAQSALGVARRVCYIEGWSPTNCQCVVNGSVDHGRSCFLNTDWEDLVRRHTEAWVVQLRGLGRYKRHNQGSLHIQEDDVVDSLRLESQHRTVDHRLCWPTSATPWIGATSWWSVYLNPCRGEGCLSTVLMAWVNPGVLYARSPILAFLAADPLPKNPSFHSPFTSAAVTLVRLNVPAVA